MQALEGCVLNGGGGGSSSGRIRRRRLVDCHVHRPRPGPFLLRHMMAVAGARGRVTLAAAPAAEACVCRRWKHTQLEGGRGWLQARGWVQQLQLDLTRGDGWCHENRATRVSLSRELFVGV